jgi:hypothetical protein
MHHFSQPRKDGIKHDRVLRLMRMPAYPAGEADPVRLQWQLIRRMKVPSIRRPKNYVVESNCGNK